MKNSIKKVIAGLSVAAMFASVMPIVSAWYDDEVDTNDFKVRQVNGGVTIEEYVGPSSAEIIIPEEINGEKVVLIDTLAFASVSNDVKIYVPESVNAQKSGWKPFLTAGAVDKGLVENVPDDQKDPIGLIQYWGKIAGVDENKLSTNYIKQQMNDAINKVVGKATGLVPDLDGLKDSLNGESLPNSEKIAQLQKDIEDAKAELDNLTIDIDYQKYEGMDAEEANKKIAEEISAQIKEKTQKLNTAIANMETELKNFDKAVETLGNLKTKVDELMKEFEPNAFADKVKDLITGEAIFNTISNGPDKLINKIRDNIAMGDSLTSIALNEIKEYKESPADYIAEWDLSEKNTERLTKAMNAIETVFEKMPQTGITLVSTEDNTALAEYAENEGIAFEIGEPEEPTTQPLQTSIVYSEVPGETSIVVSEVEGSTYTSIVTVPGSTYTSIVTVTEPKQTVISVSVSIQTIYVTESTTETTKKNLLKGDVNFNGKIDLQDILWMAQQILHPEREITEDQLYAGDINDDGKIGLVNDLLPVAKIYLQQMTSK